MIQKSISQSIQDARSKAAVSFSFHIGRRIRRSRCPKFAVTALSSSSSFDTTSGSGGVGGIIISIILRHNVRFWRRRCLLDRWLDQVFRFAGPLGQEGGHVHADPERGRLRRPFERMSALTYFKTLCIAFHVSVARGRPRRSHADQSVVVASVFVSKCVSE
jgi:hypothetical protein